MKLGTCKAQTVADATEKRQQILPKMIDTLSAPHRKPPKFGCLSDAWRWGDLHSKIEAPPVAAVPTAYNMILYAVGTAVIEPVSGLSHEKTVGHSQ